MTAQSGLQVNLLPKDSFSESLVGKILLWALSIGRYLVVFTELIVILSFLSRFKLDRDLTDLNTAIERQLAVVKSYGSLEAEFRALQLRLEQVSAIGRQNQLSRVIGGVVNYLPPDVRLKSLSFDERGLIVDGTALSSRGLTLFIQSLQRHPNIADIELSRVETEGENNPEISFSLQAVWMEGR